MPNMDSDQESTGTKRKKRREQIINSRLLSWLINLPPVAWLTRRIIQSQIKPHEDVHPPVAATIERAAASSLQATLQGIVEDVVDVLGYAGAMVATYEHGDSLPVRAFYVDPTVATGLEIRDWERRVSEFAGYPISITDPNIARVYVYDEACADNLSVQAVKAGGPVTSDDLYALFTPVAPPVSKPVVQGIQQAMGVKQVIAVPFFLEVNNPEDDGTTFELVGNLFAAKRSAISANDIMILSAFGRQAAAAIGSERHRLQIEITHELIFRVQTSLNDENMILEWIAKGVVSDLGYVGAMVAPYEPDGSLPAYALYVDPSTANEQDIHRWEKETSIVAQKLISISDPDIAKVYLDAEEYAGNLSVKAAKAGKPVTSDALYDLFVPIVPAVARPVVEEIQQTLGIKQVIAVPFFLETFSNDASGKSVPHLELVGNLFAATRSQAFKPSEIDLLRAFGEQAAAGLRNARLYRKAEERRQAAQMFGRMAFSAATSVHALRNHIGVVRLHFDLLERLNDEEREQQLEKNIYIKERLDVAAEILNTLREPWRRPVDELIDVNDCLRYAMNRAVPHEDREGISVTHELTENSLDVETSSDMLTEAFRVIIKNAFEAVNDRHRVPQVGLMSGKLSIKSRLKSYETIEVLISDNGVGIKRKDINRIFDIGWTTKKSGMGFGLFWTRDYIEGLGGYIVAESVVGEGTTFRICLPRSLPRDE